VYGWSLDNKARHEARAAQHLVEHRHFFDQFAATSKITRPEDWYDVTVKNVLDAGGSFMLRYYRGSVIEGNVIIAYVS
jgi:hypothetical protein